jgi:hypothetical protein
MVYMHWTKNIASRRFGRNRTKGGWRGFSELWITRLDGFVSGHYDESMVIPKPKWMFFASVALILSLALAVALGATAKDESSDSNKAKIVWSVRELSETLFPGTSSTTIVTFRTNQSISRVSLKATPSLGDAVKFEPAQFASIKANQDYAVRITVTAPSTFRKDTVGGTIHLRDSGDSNKTFPATLPVQIRTDFARAVASSVGVSFSYPTTLVQSSTADSFSVNSAALPFLPAGGKLPLGADESQFVSNGYAISIRRTPLHGTFSLAQWLSENSPNSVVDQQSGISVNGTSGWRITFKDEINAGSPYVLVPRGSWLYTITYVSSFGGDTPEEQSGLAVFDQVLASMVLQ